MIFLIVLLKQADGTIEFWELRSAQHLPTKLADVKLSNHPDNKSFVPARVCMYAPNQKYELLRRNSQIILLFL